MASAVVLCCDPNHSLIKGRATCFVRTIRGNCTHELLDIDETVRVGRHPDIADFIGVALFRGRFLEDKKKMCKERFLGCGDAQTVPGTTDNV